MALGLALVLRFTRSAERDERLSAELDAARRVQAQLVPLNLPSVTNLRFDAAYLPAAEVGGDFYQVIPQPSGATLIVVGDVSGKGLKAAMTGTLVVGATPFPRPGGPIAGTDSRSSQCSTRGGKRRRIRHLPLRIASRRTAISPSPTPVTSLPIATAKKCKFESGLPLGIAPGATYCESTIRLAPNRSAHLPLRRRH